MSFIKMYYDLSVSKMSSLDFQKTCIISPIFRLWGICLINLTVLEAYIPFICNEPVINS